MKKNKDDNASADTPKKRAVKPAKAQDAGAAKPAKAQDAGAAKPAKAQDAGAAKPAKADDAHAAKPAKAQDGRAAKSATAPATTLPPYQTIREQAYYFWKADGEPHGRHEEHWTRAERAILGARD